MESDDFQQRALELRLRECEDFHREVVSLLTDGDQGTMAMDSDETRFGDHVIRASAMPSNRELLLEIRRLLDLARDRPEEAESVRLQSLRESVARERRRRNAFEREFNACMAYHSALAEILGLWIEIGEQTPRSRQTPTYETVLAEVQRLKAEVEG